MKNILKILLLTIFITGFFSSILASAISKESLQELIDNKKIEEVVKEDGLYKLKVKISDEFKEVISISMDNTDLVELLLKSYNINSLIVNGDDNTIISTVENVAIDSEPQLSEKIDKYKKDGSISLDDLLIEINENKINKIYMTKNEMKKFEYRAEHQDINKLIKIKGDIATIDIPDNIPIEKTFDMNLFTYIIVFIVLVFVILSCFDI